MNIITFGINKGGTGKTTLLYNFLHYLADVLKKRILLIDGDHSINLTVSMQKVTNEPFTEPNIYQIFTKEKKELFQPDLSMIYEISENISFIPGSEKLEDGALNLKESINRGKYMHKWIAANYDILEQNFDYILIDTHNDKSYVTSDFYNVSDLIMGIVNPGENSLRAYFQLQNIVQNLYEEYYNDETGQTIVDAEVYLLGNNIDANGSTSLAFKEEIVHIDNYIGYVPKKELLNASLPFGEDIFTMYRNMPNSLKKKHQAFYDQVIDVFDRIIELAARKESA